MSGLAHHDGPRTIDTSLLCNGINYCITERIGGSMAEAAAVCFDHHSHRQGVTMRVSGTFEQAYELHWLGVTAKMKAGWNDLPYTTEQAAYGVGFLLIRDLTGYSILQRSRKATGFDYWLGNDDDMFQKKARLEVSGTGDPNEVGGRVTRKKKQTSVSADTGLPAYIVVVDFRTPMSRIESI